MLSTGPGFTRVDGRVCDRVQLGTSEIIVVAVHGSAPM